MEYEGHISRFQHQCLSLLSRFAGSERMRQMKLAEETATQGDSADQREMMEASIQQICANVMEYCQSLLLQSSLESQFCVCLFSPKMAEPASRDGPRADVQMTGVPHSRVPGMGLIIYLLKQTATDFFHFYKSHRQSVSKMQRVEHLPADEVKELCQSLVSSGVDKTSFSQRYILAKRSLVKIINNRAKLLSLCSYIIETCLFVLWRHLEYYMLHCTLANTQDSLLSARPSFRSRHPETEC